VQPGRERGGAAEVAHRLGHRKQRVLKDLGGILRVAAERHAKAIDLALMALEQHLERPAVTGAGSGEQLGVGRVGHSKGVSAPCWPAANGANPLARVWLSPSEGSFQGGKRHDFSTALRARIQHLHLLVGWPAWG